MHIVFSPIAARMSKLNIRYLLTCTILVSFISLSEHPCTLQLEKATSTQQIALLRQELISTLKTMMGYVLLYISTADLSLIVIGCLLGNHKGPCATIQDVRIMAPARLLLRKATNKPKKSSWGARSIHVTLFDLHGVNW